MADVVVELSGNEKKLLDSYRRLAEAEARQLAGLDAVAKKSKQTEDAGAKMGATLISEAKSMALQYVSVQAAIGLATRAFEHYQEKAAAATSRAERLVDVRRKLVQVSAGGNIDSLEDEANQLSATTGLDAIKARQLLFDANSLQFSGDKGLIDLIARGQTVVDPSSSASVAGKLPQVFKGLSAEDALDLLTVGAEKAAVAMEAFTPELQQAMKSGQRSAVRPEEVAAAIAMMSYKVDAPGTSLNAFLGMTAGSDELKTMNLVQQVRTLSQNESLREDILKDNKDAISAFEMLLSSLNELVASSTEIGGRVYGERVFADKTTGSRTGRTGTRTDFGLQVDAEELKRDQLLEEDLYLPEKQWALVQAEQRKAYGDTAWMNPVSDFMRGSGWLKGTSPAEALRSAATNDAAFMTQEAATSMLNAAQRIEAATTEYSAAQRARSQTQKDPG